MEQRFKEMSRRSRWRRLGAWLPSADRMGQVAGLLEVDELRAGLYEHHRVRKRAKTLPPLMLGGVRVLVLDGHEIGASYLRWCSWCLKRECTVAGETHTQYYHRYVGGLPFNRGRAFDARRRVAGARRRRNRRRHTAKHFAQHIKAAFYHEPEAPP